MSVRSNLLLRASATLFSDPLKCWLYKQQSACISRLAKCLVAVCRGLFVFSSTLALWSQPTAEVLSAKDRKHDWVGASSRISIQTESTEATNSRRLFDLCTESKNSAGIWKRQALPDCWLKPPMPDGQASDQKMCVGHLKVRRFRLIPCGGVVESFLQINLSQRALLCSTK